MCGGAGDREFPELGTRYVVWSPWEFSFVDISGDQAGFVPGTWEIITIISMYPFYEVVMVLRGGCQLAAMDRWLIWDCVICDSTPAPVRNYLWRQQNAEADWNVRTSELDFCFMYIIYESWYVDLSDMYYCVHEAVSYTICWSTEGSVFWLGNC